MDANRRAASAGLVLVAIALAAVLLLAAVDELSRERIAAQRQGALRTALERVLPGTAYDNDPLADRIELRAPGWLGSDAPRRAWRVRAAGNDAAIVLEASAPDGYAGPIHFLIGVRRDGRVGAVRVTAHQETPGLGDGIESGKGDWIDGFRDRALGQPPRERWSVRRDGGEFDQFAGATVTPRALVGAVRRVLDYLQRHGDEIYAAAPGATIEHQDAPDH